MLIQQNPAPDNVKNDVDCAGGLEPPFPLLVFFDIPYNVCFLQDPNLPHVPAFRDAQYFKELNNCLFFFRFLSPSKRRKPIYRQLLYAGYKSRLRTLSTLTSI